MSEQQPRVETVSVERVIGAEWNYNEAGDPATIEKLKASILHDRSAGVIAVRELDDGRLEAIDGNHRLAVMRELGWKEIAVENFGKISLAEAVVISRRRNHQWFRDDAIMLGELYAKEVIPEIDLDALVGFMPETREEIERLMDMADGHLPNMDGKEDRKAPGSKPEMYRLNMSRPEYAAAIGAVELLRVRERDQSVSEGRALELICADYLAGVGMGKG